MKFSIARTVLFFAGCAVAHPLIIEWALRQLDLNVAKHSLMIERLHEDPATVLPIIYPEWPDYAELLKSMTPEQLIAEVNKAEARLIEALVSNGKVASTLENGSASDYLLSRISTDHFLTAMALKSIEDIIALFEQMKNAPLPEVYHRLRMPQSKSALKSLDLFLLPEKSLDRLLGTNDSDAEVLLHFIMDANISELGKIRDSGKAGNLSFLQIQRILKAAQEFGLINISDTFRIMKISN